MENSVKECFCKLFSNIPVLPFPNGTIIESIKKDKNGKLICRKCGRIVTYKEIEERARKIPSVVW